MKKLSLITIALLFATIASAQVLKGSKVLLNGKPFANAVLVNGQWAVSLEDFAKAGGSSLTLEPHFQLRGNTLVAISSGGDRSMDKHKIQTSAQGVTEYKPQLPAIKGEVKTAPGTLFHVQNGGTISSRVFLFRGKSYVPLADIARAFGGTLNAPAPKGNETPTESLSLNFTKVQWSTLAGN